MNLMDKISKFQRFYFALEAWNLGPMGEEDWTENAFGYSQPKEWRRNGFKKILKKSHKEETVSGGHTTSLLFRPP